MPIAESGYRRWEGTLGRPLLPWWPITKGGIELQRANLMLRRFLFIGWAPVLFYAALFLGTGWATEPGVLESAAAGEGGDQPFVAALAGPILRGVLGEDLYTELVLHPDAVRPLIWAFLLYTFLRQTQVLLVVILVALVGPRLVSDDIRTNALAIYFSRPLAPHDYILGKLSIILTFVFAVTLVPSVLLYGLGVAFSPSLDVIRETYPVLGRAILASLVVAVPVSLLMLALSALTSSPRILTALWFGIWAIGWIAGRIVVQSGLEWGRRFSIFADLSDAAWIALDLERLSAPYREQGTALADLFRQVGPPIDPQAALVILYVMVAASIVVLAARIRPHGIGGG